MRTIEIAGPVGAGKTSVIEPLRTILAARGRVAITLDEACARQRPQLGRWALTAAAARFVVRRPGLAVSIASSLLRSPIPAWHRARIILLVLKLAARIDLVGRELGSHTTLIIDEGWVHRALNIFAWRTEDPSQRELDAYLDRVPLRGVVIVVHADADTVRSRVGRRGLPKRLAGRSAAEIEAFLSRGERILARSEASLSANPRGLLLVRVSNDGAPADLRATLERALSGQQVRRVPAHRQAWPSAPRPDRVAIRLRRQGSNLLPAELAQRAAESAGLREAVAIGGGVSPGGRGSVRAVRDRDGLLWLVKRYKDSLADADIAVEHAVLGRLADCLLPASRLVQAPGSDGIVRIGDSRFAVYALAVGYVHPHERWFAPSDRRRLERLSGTLLATLHQGLRGFEPPPASQHGFGSLAGPRIRPVGWFTERLDALADHPRFREVLADREAIRTAQALTQLDRSLESARLQRSVVHGDFGPYNLLVRPGREPLAIDWELSRLDWRIVDLATGIPRFAQRRTGWDAAAADRFLNAYERRAPLDREDRRMIPSVAGYLALRRAIVCIDRWVQTGDVRQRDEAGERLAYARRLASGSHPLVRLVQARG